MKAMTATVGIFGVLGLGLVAIVSLRRQEEATPPPPSAKVVVRKTPAPDPTPSRVAGDDGLELLRNRVVELEQRTTALRARKDELLVQKAALEETRKKEGLAAVEQNARASSRAGAEDMISDWEAPLRLSPRQAEYLKELWARWEREEYNRRYTVDEWRAARDTWRVREEQLRAFLSADQSAHLNRHLRKYVTRFWSAMPEFLGGFAGIAREDWDSLRERLGEAPAVPSAALLPEPHGLDRWTAFQ